MSAPTLRTHVVILGKSWWQKLEAAGHMPSTVRKQGRMSAGAQLGSSFSFYAAQDQTLGNGAIFLYGGSSHRN